MLINYREQGFNLETFNGPETLRRLREQTLSGHGRNGKDPFDWEPTAAALDFALAHPGQVPMTDMKRMLEEREPGEWTFSIQLAEPQPLPEAIKDQELGNTQFHLIDSVDRLPLLAGDNPLIRGMVQYGLGSDKPSEILQEIIYDPERPDRSPIRMFRLDMVGGERISEAQLSAAGWDIAERVSEQDHLIGSNHRVAREFTHAMRAATAVKRPTMGVLVDKGVSTYWPEWVDFRLAAQRVAPDVPMFAAGNHGFRYDGDRLLYQNAVSGEQAPLDVVYTMADARRLLADEWLPVLQAVRDGRVQMQPTLNPLLNNYHLIRSLLFHADKGLQDLLVRAMAEAGAGIPDTALQKAREQTIPMSLVDAENTIEMDGEKYSWADIIESYGVNNGGANVFTKSRKKGFIVRTLLSHDLRALSGGRGSTKMSNKHNKDLASMFTESAAGVAELRETGWTDKTIVGVEPLVTHEPPSVTVFRHNEDGVISETIPAIQRACPFFVRTGTTKDVRLAGAISFYSDSRENITDAFRVAGRSYAVGAHY